MKKLLMLLLIPAVFGESATDGELYSVCEILCYEDIPYVTLKIAGMKMTFKVSDTAMEYLTDYFH